MKELRVFKGVWIPAEIWVSEELEIIEKVMLIEIDSLDNEFGCIATNQYFATFFKRSVSRVSEIIAKLFELGYLHIFYANDNKRTITTTEKFKALKGGFGKPNSYSENTKTYSENTKTYSENTQTYSENTKTNSNTSNNTFNNTFSESVTHPQKISNESLNSQKNTLQKVAPKSFPSEMSFQESIYNDFSCFTALLSALNVRTSDHEAIYKKISLNAKSKNLLKSDWRAYIELWINNDIDKGTVNLNKATNQESAKNDASMLDEQQDEIFRKVKLMYKDYKKGDLVNTQVKISAIEFLRILWKDADESNRELISNFVAELNQPNECKEVEETNNHSQEKPQKNVKGSGSRMRDKFNSNKQA